MVSDSPVHRALAAEPVVTTREAIDQVCLADWDEAVLVSFCSIEYKDLKDDYWSVEQALDEQGIPMYRVYHHGSLTDPVHTSYLLSEVACLLSSCSSCLAANVWGTIGEHPWRPMPPDYLDVVVQAAAKEQICGQFGEAVPPKISRLAAQLLLCLVPPGDEADVARRLAAGEEVSLCPDTAQMQPAELGNGSGHKR